MKVQHVEFIVEEPSMEAALRLLLPKMLDGPSFEIYAHQCKNELLERLPERLRGYSQRRAKDAWFRDHCRIIVLVDRDDEDCIELKRKLNLAATRAGLSTRTNARGTNFAIVNRLVIEELEAWYFGDWDAVRSAYPRVSEMIPFQAKFRIPDAITGGTWEAFERVLKKYGYFSGGLRKVEAAHAIARQMSPEANTSQSFIAFKEVVEELRHV